MLYPPEVLKHRVRCHARDVRASATRHAGSQTPAQSLHSTPTSNIGLDDARLQAQLRRVQLAIHPDRVAQHEHARAANTAAFAAIQAYVRALRSDGASPEAAAQLYHLDFYAWLRSAPGDASESLWRHVDTDPGGGGAMSALRDPRNWPREQDSPVAARSSASKADAAAAGSTLHQIDAQDLSSRADLHSAAPERAAADLKLSRVTMRLPPPPPGCAEHLPRQVRRALAALFRSLDLESVFGDEEEQASPVGSLLPRISFFWSSDARHTSAAYMPWGYSHAHVGMSC